jgi:hypothetical protein
MTSEFDESDNPQPDDASPGTEGSLAAPRAVYVHLTGDGGIFWIRGDTGEARWVTEEQLLEELQLAKARDGFVLYSRDSPDGTPPAIVAATFERIAELHMPLHLLSEPHPAVASGFKDAATTLMMASHAGEAELVSDLISRGAHLDATDVDGLTALMYAANMGREDVVTLLLEAGANVNATDSQNSTAVMFAAQHGHTDTVRRLIDAGADLSVRGDHGLTALGFALQNGHRKTRRVLKEAGAIT